MVDYYNWQLHGEQLTNCEYHLDNYGAVCFDIPDTAKQLIGKDLEMTVEIFSNGKQLTYKPMDNYNPEFNLTEDQESVLRLVIERHSGQKLPELKKSHYETEPMQKVKNKGDKLDMNAINQVIKIKDNAQIKALQKHIKTIDLSARGSKEDRATHCKSVLAAMDTTRGRANAAILQGK